MKKFEEEEHVNHERWLITYSDLITLLLIFFIILYTFSKVDQAKYESLANGLNATFGNNTGTIIGEGNENILPPDFPNSSNEEEEKNKLDDLKNEVDQYINESNLGNEIITNVEERGLVISIQAETFFNSGDAAIQPTLRESLLKIGTILTKIQNYIRIEGHTDTVPINNDKFPSNWELSVIRATNVSHILIQEVGIHPDKIACIGYGEYRPIADNTTEAGRAKNRRVDIVIMDTKYNASESK